MMMLLIAMGLAMLMTALSYPTYLKCTQSLAVGTNYMPGRSGQSAAAKDNSYAVVIKRGTTALSSGDKYVGGESLTISFSGTAGNYIFESNQPVFMSDKSACGNKRIYRCSSSTNCENTGTTTTSNVKWDGSILYSLSPASSWSITMPTDGSIVEIFVAWYTSSYVRITDTFTLVSSSTSVLTLMNYELQVKLTNITETSARGYNDKLRLSMMTSFDSFYPPYNVTISDYRNSTEQAASSSRKLAASLSQLYVYFNIYFILEESDFSTEAEFTGALDIASALVLDGGIYNTQLAATGVGVLIDVSATTRSALSYVSSTTFGTLAPTREPTLAPVVTYSTQDAGHFKTAIAVTICASTLIGGLVSCFTKSRKDAVMFVMLSYAVIVAVLAIVLTNLWAADKNNGLDVGFLGTPTGDNLFAYHPQIMISCFFFFQILAISSWSVFPVYLISKISHVAFNTAALISMAYGLYIIVKACIKNDSPGFVTLHSWIGVLCAIVFSLNYLYGMSMGVAKVVTSGLGEGKARRVVGGLVLKGGVFIKHYHKYLGAAALMLTALSIVTGIVLRMGGACLYIDSQSTLEITESMNRAPHNYFDSIPLSCKLSNGAGIAVILSSFCVIALALTRNVAGGHHTHETAFAKDRQSGKIYTASDSTTELSATGLPAFPEPTAEAVTIIEDGK